MFQGLTLTLNRWPQGSQNSPKQIQASETKYLNWNWSYRASKHLREILVKLGFLSRKTRMSSNVFVINEDKMNIKRKMVNFSALFFIVMLKKIL